MVHGTPTSEWYTNRSGQGIRYRSRPSGLELLGIAGYIFAIQFPNAPEKYGFLYRKQTRTPLSVRKENFSNIID